MGLVLDPGLRDQPALLQLRGRARTAVPVDRGRSAGPSPTTGAPPPGSPIRCSATSRSTPASGRHGGCRLRFTPDGALLIGTGDNAVGSNPQDRSSRGRARCCSPTPGHRRGRTRCVHYGHRNVQGLAVRPGTGQVFSVEQGTFRDDEVNLLRAGRQLRLRPERRRRQLRRERADDRPGIPGAIAGGVVLRDRRRSPPAAARSWTATMGELRRADAARRAQGPGRARAAAGRRRRAAEAVPAARAGGHLRPDPDVQQGTDGALYVTTDNGGGGDQLLRVTPSGSLIRKITPCSGTRPSRCRCRRGAAAGRRGPRLRATSSWSAIIAS